MVCFYQHRKMRFSTEGGDLEDEGVAEEGDLEDGGGV